MHFGRTNSHTEYFMNRPTQKLETVEEEKDLGIISSHSLT